MFLYILLNVASAILRFSDGLMVCYEAPRHLVGRCIHVRHANDAACDMPKYVFVACSLNIMVGHARYRGTHMGRWRGGFCVF